MNKEILIPVNPNNKYLKEYSKAVERGLAARHIVARENGWAIVGINNKKASAVATTKNEAISIGKQIADKSNIDLFIHKKNGEIERRYSPKK